MLILPIFSTLKGIHSDVLCHNYLNQLQQFELADSRNVSKSWLAEDYFSNLVEMLQRRGDVFVSVFSFDFSSQHVSISMQRPVACHIISIGHKPIGGNPQHFQEIEMSLERLRASEEGADGSLESSMDFLDSLVCVRCYSYQSISLSL